LKALGRLTARSELLEQQRVATCPADEPANRDGRQARTQLLDERDRRRLAEWLDRQQLESSFAQLVERGCYAGIAAADRATTVRRPARTG
jgi:hypothetical protein